MASQMERDGYSRHETCGSAFLFDRNVMTHFKLVTLISSKAQHDNGEN